MEKLTFEDANTLNAIAGFLNVLGLHKEADVLYRLQCKIVSTLDNAEEMSE